MKLHGNDIMNLKRYDKKTLCQIIVESEKYMPEELTMEELLFLQICEKTVHFLDFTDQHMGGRLKLYGDKISDIAMAGAMLYRGGMQEGRISKEREKMFVESFAGVLMFFLWNYNHGYTTQRKRDRNYSPDNASFQLKYSLDLATGTQCFTKIGVQRGLEGVDSKIYFMDALKIATGFIREDYVEFENDRFALDLPYFTYRIYYDLTGGMIENPPIPLKTQMTEEKQKRETD